MILLNYKHIQTPENSRPSNHHSWIQVYILMTPKGMDETIWNLDLKYFTNKHDILHTHWMILLHSKHIKTPENLHPINHHRWTQVYILTTPKGMDDMI